MWQGHFNLLHKTFIHLPGGPTCLTPLFSQPQRTSSSSSSSILLILSFKMYLQKRVLRKLRGSTFLLVSLALTLSCSPLLAGEVGLSVVCACVLGWVCQRGGLFALNAKPMMTFTDALVGLTLLCAVWGSGSPPGGAFRGSGHLSPSWLGPARGDPPPHPVWLCVLLHCDVPQMA